MGEGTHGVGPRAAARKVEGEIEQLRRNLDSSLAALDRRRHELVDFRLQAARHPLAMAVVAGGILLAAAALAASIYLRRRRERPVPRLRRIGSALARMAGEPEKVARGKPSVGEKIVAAAGAAAATAITRKLIEQAWPQPT